MEKLIETYKKKRAFVGASEEEMKTLLELEKDSLPEELILFFKEAMAEKEVKMGDFVLYPIERVKEENLNYVPGANIYPLGLFTFASTLGGDAICVDITKPEGHVYQCSHSLLSDSEIAFYKQKMVSLELNYENVIKCSVELAGSFKEFMEWVKTGRRRCYNVTSYVLDNYKE